VTVLQKPILPEIIFQIVEEVETPVIIAPRDAISSKWEWQRFADLD
jgi:hypothetical protein